MKRIKTILAAVVSMIALVSCQQEIADFTNRLDDLENRVSKLEQLCSEMNSNISSLQSIVTAIQTGDYITSIKEITEGDKTIGYTITFAKGDPITIYHGQDGKDGADGHTPVVGVKQDTDAIWYWTVDGKWLYDSNNQKVKAVGTDGKDGVTPQLKIEDGYWYVSTDNGQTWTKLDKATGADGKDDKDGKDGTDGKEGKDGDSMFQSVTVTETEVTFVTADGQTFVIKRASALSIEFDSADLVVMGTNSTRDIHYTITSGLDDVAIEALSSADIKVKVVKTDAKTGALNVKTGAAIDEYSKVVVLVSNDSQAIVRTLNFEAEAINVEENTTKNVSDEGGEVTLEFFSNVPCRAVIPVDAQSWISVAPETKALTKQTIGLIVQPNTGASRSATVVVQGEDGSLALSFIIEQQKKQTTKALLPNPLLPDNVDKTKITEISFIVNSDKTTDVTIPTPSATPIYFELDGTTAKYYTKADVYTLEDASTLFFRWSSLKSIDLTNIETNSVTNMCLMFAACNSLKSITFGEFNTANVTQMELMFGDCWALESLDVSGFETHNVKDMYQMFAGCSSLKSLDLSSFDTSNVEDMRFMFGHAAISQDANVNWIVGCSSIEHLDLHSFNTSKVKHLEGMFEYCSSLKTVNLSGWNTSCAENISGLFSQCISLESVDLSSFDTRNVTAMASVFENCVSLKSIDLSFFVTSNVTSMSNMFSGCKSLQSLDISSFDASSLTDIMFLFSGVAKIKELDLGSFDISKVDITQAAFSSLAFKSKTVAIRCIDKTKKVIESLADGTYFNLDYVTWVGLDEAIPDLPDITDPNMYFSGDFSMDKKVKVLQSATEGKGVDIVIMGDAYSDRLIADGTYENDMREAIDAIFDVEPMKSYKHLFNVYMVYAVSENEVRDGATVFGLYKNIPNNVICNAYTRVAVSDKPLSDIATIVIGYDLNAFDGVLGNVWTVFNDGDEYCDYGQAQQCIAAIGRWEGAKYTGTVVHEFGHLFAKLADEYVNKDEAFGASDEYEIQNFLYLCQWLGVWKNVDLTSNPETIKWSRFIKDSRYENECLGAYEGGNLYSKGVWRPTEASLMSSSSWKHGYNAPSREATYNRIHKLAYGKDWQYDYETFVQQDLKNIPAEPYFQSSPKYVPYPKRTPQKHLFKMEESIAPDGKKMVTIIMD